MIWQDNYLRSSQYLMTNLFVILRLNFRLEQRDDIINLYLSFDLMKFRHLSINTMHFIQLNKNNSISIILGDPSIIESPFSLTNSYVYPILLEHWSNSFPYKLRSGPYPNYGPTIYLEYKVNLFSYNL